MTKRVLDKNKIKEIFNFIYITCNIKYHCYNFVF